MRMHGSILPKLILPLLAVAVWSSAISVIHFYRTKRKQTIPRENCSVRAPIYHDTEHIGKPLSRDKLDPSHGNRLRCRLGSLIP